jgi:hypothetical protein
MEREALRRLGDLAFPVRQGVGLRHRQRRASSYRRSVHITLRPVNHKFASNVPKSVKSLDCRTQLVRAEG